MKLTETGLPPRDEIIRLGLDFVIPVLEPMGAGRPVTNVRSISLATNG